MNLEHRSKSCVNQLFSVLLNRPSSAIDIATFFDAIGRRDFGMAHKLASGPGASAAGSENTERKQRPQRFMPGQSGNPCGRPPGSRNKTTLAIEALLDGEAEALTRKAIELAKAGDLASLRLCLDRVCPPRKDRPVNFSIPALETAADVKRAASAIVKAVAEGELTPSEASELSRLLDNFTRVLEATDFDERLSKLETRR
jgi:hypothetical protein